MTLTVPLAETIQLPDPYIRLLPINNMGLNIENYINYQLSGKKKLKTGHSKH